MNRCLAFLAALILAFVSVSSACTAAGGPWIRFALQPQRGDGGRIEASFRSHAPGEDSNWSSDFRSSELVGLDVAGLRSGGTRPIHFALVRDPGRLDCNGRGGGSYATGDCSFTPDPGFAQLLASRGIGRPTPEQALGLFALDVRRTLVEAIAAAHYPTPTLGDLSSLAALGVDGDYVTRLARAGYRPGTIRSLTTFKALGITPEWIGGFVRIGYADVGAEGLAQLKALGIDPDFVAGFERAGYRHLPVDTLVQLKALDITPEFVRAVAAEGAPLPAVRRLVEMKVSGPTR
jgi:hypothetical protein